jgi:hypothetical protein
MDPQNFNISRKEQAQAIQSASEDLKTTGPGMLGYYIYNCSFFADTCSSFTIIYIPDIVLPRTDQEILHRHICQTNTVLVLKKCYTESRIIIQSYMVGLLIEMAIVAALNATRILLLSVSSTPYSLRFLPPS